jgi:tetratricopeptide (TPR) repeat protein
MCAMKERLLADLDARIVRHANGDSSGVLEERALALVRELAELGEPDAGSLVRVAALHLCRYEALPPEHGELDLELAESIYTDLHRVDPRLVSARVRDFFGLASPHESGVARMREFERTGGQNHLERAISLFRQEVVDPQADRADGLYSLGMALLSRFKLSGRMADLRESIELCRGALTVVGRDDRRLVMFQSGLAEGLLRRFELAAGLSDVDEAIDMCRAVVAAGGQEQARHLANLGVALFRRWVRAGEAGDLDEAIEVSRRAVAIDPEHRLNLATALRTRYELAGRQADLEEAERLGAQ